MSASVGTKAKRVSRANKKSENLKEKKKSEKNKGYAFKQLLVIIFLAASLLVYEFFLKESQREDLRQPQVTQVSRANQSPPDQGVTTSENLASRESKPDKKPNTSMLVSELVKHDLCTNEISELCKEIFIEKQSHDFIIRHENENTLEIYFERNHALRVLFFNNPNEYYVQSKSKKIDTVLASATTLKKNVLQTLEGMNIRTVRINIYKKYGDKIIGGNLYRIDTDVYRKINYAEFQLAIEKVKTSGDYSYFDKYVIQHLEVVSGK